ncbi:MAG: hypothetical protein Q9204_009494 [Flavoplaca sp. TL-2023a]
MGWRSFKMSFESGHHRHGRCRIVSLSFRRLQKSAFPGPENTAHKINPSSILFLITSFISIKNLLYYRRNGSNPALTSASISHPIPLHEDDDQTKYAFSSNPHDDYDNDDEHLGNAGPSTAPNTTYELLHDSQRPDVGANPHSSGPYDEDTSYHSTTLASAPQLPPHRDPFRDRDPSPYRVQQRVEDEEDAGYQGRYDADGYGGGAAAAGAGDPFRDDLALSHDHGGYAGGSGGENGSGRVDFPRADYGRT